jgi:hypothetical protein
LEEPRDPETRVPPNCVILADDEDVAGWLSKTRGLVVLRMLVILCRKPYNGPGKNGEAGYLNTDTPPEAGDPPYIPADLLIRALAQVQGMDADVDARAAEMIRNEDLAGGSSSK